MSVLLNDKAKAIINLAQQYLGSPYVYAGAGQVCTPENRKAKINSTYPDIINKCQVLNEKQLPNCSGCKYDGRRFFDCRGFTYWILKQNGINISAIGATTQYNTGDSWDMRGKVTDMPNVVCCVFKYKEDEKKMSHTGLHVGNGVIIHCTGVKAGEVQYDAVGGQGWTHFGIPKSLYTHDQLQAAEQLSILTGLKRGSAGVNVTELQQKLNELGYNCDVDGRYGTNTAAAVKAFQEAYNLTADGIAGAITRTLLLNLTNNNTSSPILSDNIQPISHDDNDMVTITLPKNVVEILYRSFAKIM